MNYLRDCRTCGGPVYGSWLYSYHTCKPTPYAVLYQAPLAALPDTEPLPAIVLADKITPGEATRLCHLIRERIEEHSKYCGYCKMQLKNFPCTDMPKLQEAFEKWEQYTLIEVDRHANQERG